MRVIVGANDEAIVLPTEVTTRCKFVNPVLRSEADFTASRLITMPSR